MIARVLGRRYRVRGTAKHIEGKAQRIAHASAARATHSRPRTAVEAANASVKAAARLWATLWENAACPSCRSRRIRSRN